MAKKIDTLQAGDITNYPTWAGWGTTNVVVENKGTQQCAFSLIAGAGQETHNLDVGERRPYPRQWGGFRLYVRNEGDQVGEHILEVTVY